MKIRIGFVSNSSSSSFIVAAKDNVKMKVEVEVDLKDFSEYIIKTVEELKTLIEEFYIEPKDLNNDDRYKEAKKAIENGKVVYFGEFSDEGYGPLQYMFCHRGMRDEDFESQDVEVIYSKAGY